MRSRADRSAPCWERPTRRRRSPWWWLAAAAALAVVVGGLAGGTGVGGDGELAVEEDDDVATDPTRRAEVAETRFHPDLDNAQAVTAGPDGDVWVGTRGGGLVRWDADGGDFDRHPLPGDLRGARVTSVAAGADGALWVALGRRAELGTTAGVARFDGDEWTTWSTDDGLAPAYTEVALGPDGTVWAGAHRAGGLVRFDGGDWAASRLGDEVGVDPDAEGGARLGVESLAVDDEAVWVATSSGIARIGDDGRITWTARDDLPLEHPRALVRAITTGPDGRVWAAATTLPRSPEDDERTALLRLDGGDWVRAAELPSQTIRSLAVDADGGVWAAAEPSQPGRDREPGALHRFDGDAWTRVATEDGLPHHAVRSVSVGADGAVWAATAGGAARFDDGEWVLWRTGQGPAGRIRAVATGEDGSVWVATTTGVARYDGKAWTRWAADEGLADDEAVDVVVAGDGEVWAATPRGVSRFDGERWTSWTADDGLAHDRVRSVAVGGDGTVWVGTATGPWPAPDPPTAGVSRFDGEQWVSWTSEEDGLADGEVTGLAVDADGAVWAATHGSRPDPDAEDGFADGVSRFDGEQWSTHTTGDGLAHYDVHSVAADSRGLVWAATDRGISRFNGETWQGHRDDFGLERDHPATDALHAVATDADGGAVWAVGTDALIHFDGQTWTAVDGDDLPTGAASVAPDGATSVAPAEGSAVWIGTWRGLVRLELAD